MCLQLCHLKSVINLIIILLKLYWRSLSSQTTITALLRTTQSKTIATVTKDKNFSALIIFCSIQVALIAK